MLSTREKLKENSSPNNTKIIKTLHRTIYFAHNYYFGDIEDV
jgi:hypothetical protein